MPNEAFLAYPTASFGDQIVATARRELPGSRRDRLFPSLILRHPRIIKFLTVEMAHDLGRSGMLLMFMCRIDDLLALWIWLLRHFSSWRLGDRIGCPLVTTRGGVALRKVSSADGDKTTRREN